MHLALAGGYLSREDFEEGGFSCAVGADYPVAVAGDELDGNLFEEFLIAII
jgi:hypothetical protein